MGVYGNIETMPVPELFGWLGGARKSGTLEVERDKIVKRIMFREGRVVGCSSNEPATLMGQFLLSRGKITAKQLAEGMRRQGQSDRNLGEILAEMGAVSSADRDQFISHKIAETIYGLFDWTEAVFRFYTDALPDPNVLGVNFDTREILQRGLERITERQRSREVISDPRLVLRPTGRSVPAGLEELPAAKRVLELIDGRRTVADILLHSHAPEFLVSKFLTALVHGGVLEVHEPSIDTGSVAQESIVTQSEPNAAPRDRDLEPTPPVEAEVDPTGLPDEDGEESTERDVPPFTVAFELSDSSDEFGDMEPKSGDTPPQSGGAIATPDDRVEQREDSDVQPVDAAGPVLEAPASTVAVAEKSGVPIDVTHARTIASIESALGLLELDAGTSPAGRNGTRPAKIARDAVSVVNAPASSEVASSTHAEDGSTVDDPGQPLDPETSRNLQREINVALQLMSNGQPEAALELLNAMAAKHPGDVALAKLVDNAEQDYLQLMMAGELSASRIPARTSSAEADAGIRMTPEESFLISHIDGVADVQALLWITPMREVEVLKTLSCLLRKGQIEMRQAA